MGTGEADKLPPVGSEGDNMFEGTPMPRHRSGAGGFATASGTTTRAWLTAARSRVARTISLLMTAALTAGLMALVPTPAAAFLSTAISRDDLAAAPEFDPIVSSLGTFDGDLGRAGDPLWQAPRLSRDNRWVAYTGTTEVQPTVGRLEVATRQRERLTTLHSFAPDISGDGSRIVYLAKNPTTNANEVWLWDVSTGNRRLSANGARIGTNHTSPVQISNDGRTVTWAQVRDGQTRLAVWRNGDVSVRNAPYGPMSGNGRWVLVQKQYSGQLRYDIGNDTTSQARSTGLSYFAVSDDGSRYVGSGFTDDTVAGISGWMGVWGRTAVDDVFAVAHPAKTRVPLPLQMSGDGTTILAPGDEPGRSYLIKTDTLSTAALNTYGWSVLALSETGRHGLVGIDLGPGNGYRLGIADLTHPAVPSVSTGDLTGSQLSDQVGRLYTTVFDRTPSETEVGHWLAVRASGSSLVDVAAQFTAADEFTSRYGDIDDGGFVDLLYRNVLGRSADAEGRRHWLAQLNNGMSRAELVVAFSESPELVARTSTVAARPPEANQVWRLYRAYFLRHADQVGLDYWYRAVLAGTPLAAVSDNFARSDEFRQRYGELDDPAFVDLVYRNVLGRQPDGEGRTYWLSRLEAGMTRGQLMVAFSESQEFIVRTDTIP